MPDDATTAVTAALERMLLRGFRNGLYEHLQHGVDVEVRDGTHPILRGLLDGPATSTALAQRIGLDRTTVSRQVGVLVSAGAVDRRRGPADARTELLTLTPSGRRSAERLRDNADDLVAGVLHAWPEEDRDALARLLPRLVEELVRPG